MKNIFNILVLALCCFTACDHKLDIEPEQSLSDEVAFSSFNNAKGVMIGTYNLMMDVAVFGSIPQTLSDCMTDNINFSGELPNMQGFNNFIITSTNSIPNDNWKDTYQIIGTTNTIIQNAPNIPDASNEQKAAMIGEAKFIRALSYFLLSELYSQPYQVSNGENLSVPIYLKPFDGVNFELKARNSLKQVYDQVELDLKDAETSLPAQVRQGFPSSASATAMLSRLYLYKREWDKAATAAQRVISGNYALHPDLSFYSTISSEIIFSLEHTATVSGTADNDIEESFAGWDAYYNGRDGGGRGDAEFSDDLATLFQEDPMDARGLFKETGTDFGGSPAQYTLKYNNPDGSSDFPMIRIAEIMLNRAEALVHLNGINQESVDLVSDIRERAGTSRWDINNFTSDEELLEAIYIERRKELCFEGHRRMDLLRTGKPLRSSTTIFPNEVTVENAGLNVMAGNNLAIWPIPQTQLDQNTLFLVSSHFQVSFLF